MSSYNILLADNHVLVRKLIKKIIETDPDLNVVAEVSDGFELLNKLRVFKVNLIILDITMPNLSGMEVTERIKENYPDIKVLIFTIHKGTQFMHHAFRVGADGYLSKDDAPKELLAAIKMMREDGHYIPPFMSPYLESRGDT